MAKKRKHKGKRGKDPVAPVTASRAYDAAMYTPARRPPVGADGSQDQAAEQGLGALRCWGRYLDENHDVASGVLDELVKNIVGSGILTVPKPLREDGTVDADLAADITRVWMPWTRQADVTGELSWHEAQRLACRAWLRDGESFIQHITGRARGYRFASTQVPYRFELLESDMVPWELTDDTWRQGVRHDGWRRPIEYAVFREHPGDMHSFMGRVSPETLTTVPAAQMSHIKVVKRWPATRGISLFSATVSRLYDIKDLEESERLKDRILASWVAAVIKSPDLIGQERTAEDGKRFLDMFEGSVIDTLAAGESIQGVGPDYPVANMPDHIADQMRRVAAGTGTRYSSIAKRYDGTYSAQRQEMVESEGLYQMREDNFIAKVCREVYVRWLTAAVLDRKVLLPAGMDLERAANAEYRGPVTPWIDPLKEVQADALAVEHGFSSLEQVQIKRGASPELIASTTAADTRDDRPPVQLELVDDEEEDAA